MDSGSTFCIVSSSCLKSLSVPPSDIKKLKQPIYLQPLNGNTCSAMFSADLNVSFQEITILITFLILEDMSCDIMLGIDNLKKYECVIDYSKDSLTLNYNSQQVKLQLYTKSELKYVIDIDDSTNSDQDSDADSEEDDDDDQDAGPAFLLHATTKEYIREPPLSMFRLSDVQQHSIFNEPQILHDLLPSVQSLFIQYSNLFAVDFTEIPGIQNSEYSLRVLPDKNHSPIASKLRRYNPVQREAIRVEITKMLGSNVIEESNSPWSFPIVLVPKPDQSIRFCINYKKLNAITIKDKFPLPRIDDCLDSLAGKHIISTLDCFAGYWQIPIAESTRDFTSFISPFGTYRFRVMPFGLSNAPAHFSRVMQQLFAPYLYDFMVVYLDDLCIFSDSVQDHLKHLRLVFEKLASHNIRLKFKKCHFFQTSFIYLGYHLSFAGVQPSPEKVKALVNLEAPTNVKLLRSFLGLASYFRKFIANFSIVVKPLQDLIVSPRFSWSVECDRCFNLVKHLLTSDPILQLPDFDKMFILSTDASSYAVGAVLEQDFDGEVKPIAYYSRKLNKSEQNYSNYEKEALAVVAGFKQFYKYLIIQRFIVFTDNSAVASILNSKEPSGRIIRWINYLLSFDF